MPRLAAGQLRHRLSIRRVQEVPNGKGGFKSDWSEITNGKVSAEVTGLDGRESVMDQALQGISVYRIRIRWRPDVRTSDQLRTKGSAFGYDDKGVPRDLNIRSAVDPDGRREQLVIIADTASTRT
jgi:head-tail adaptor